eukprot:3733634-Alexandrium_andersonii.AAC.1
MAQRAQASVEAAAAPFPRSAVGTGAASSSGSRLGREGPESRPEPAFAGGGPAASELVCWAPTTRCRTSA